MGAPVTKRIAPIPPLPDAINAAQAADDAFEAAIKAAGYKSRWSWRVANGPQELLTAYLAKVSADNTMHAAFEASRQATT